MLILQSFGLIRQDSHPSFYNIKTLYNLHISDEQVQDQMFLQIENAFVS